MEKVLTTLIIMLGLCFIAAKISGGASSEALSTPAAMPEFHAPQGTTTPLNQSDRDGTMVFPPGGGTADSNGRMIAVTGTDLTGTSILYLIDTVDHQLAVYQAQGGAKGTRKIVLVGARRIDYDLQMLGFHDESEYTWRELDAEFRKRGESEGKAPAKRPSGAFDPGVPERAEKGSGE